MSKTQNKLWSKLVVSLVFLTVFSSDVTQAATYFVRTNGNNSHNGLTNSSAGAWLTIDHAADSVSPGDVIRVQEGLYQERVTPGVNGSSVTNTITLIADGSVTVCGFEFNNSAYIRVIGFTIDSDAGSCSIQSGCVLMGGNSNDHLEFWNNTFRDARYNGIRMGVNDISNNSLIVGNTFLNFGIGNGSGVAVGTRGESNIIAYNEIDNSHPDAFYMFGSNNRWLNNYTHDLSEASGGHSDVFQTGSSNEGWSGNLFEGHFQVGMGSLGDEHTAQISHAQAAIYCSGSCGDMTENVFRRNVWHNVSQGTIGINQTSDGPVTHTRYYHNTTAEACENAPATRYGLSWFGPGTSNSYVHNNIEYESWGNSATSNLEVYYVTGGLTLNYNLAFDPNGGVSFASPWTTQSNAQSNANPSFVDYDNDDFHIRSSSAAIGQGGPLTTTVGAGTGTTFNVATRGGGFFRGDDPSISQYGGNLVVGDVVTVGTDTVRIASVSGDSITVTQAFTWADGDDVYFGDDTTPDIGAYPYKAGGYNITATYANNNGTVAVVPSDPSLVRMAVVFEDGIPVGADSISPYLISGVGNGALEVRVYPLFASKTLYVTATQGSGDTTPPAAPENLRIGN